MDQPLNIAAVVQNILHNALADNTAYSADTPLLGANPEFDSTSIMTILTLLEDQLDLYFSDDELSAEIFVTFGSLCNFVEQKI